MIDLTRFPANLVAWFSIGYVIGQVTMWVLDSTRDKLRRLRYRSPKGKRG